MANTMSKPDLSDSINYLVHNILAQSNYMVNTKYDLTSDASIQRYISTIHPFNDPKYEPFDLVEVDTSFVITRTQKPLLRPEAAKAFVALSQKFYEEFNKKLVLVSAYRSYTDQQNLIVSTWCPKSRCAAAGTSEHQAWLAVDIHIGDDRGYRASMSNKDSKYYKWLENNAYKFGFHNTFQKWMHIDGQMEEGRHRRYVWLGLARTLWENNMTLGEYFKEQSQ